MNLLEAGQLVLYGPQFGHQRVQAVVVGSPRDTCLLLQ